MNSVYLIIASLLLGIVAATKWHELEGYTFEDYKVEFNKEYSSKINHEVHQEIFAARLAEIKAHNADGTKSWKLGVNKFTDMTEDELKMHKGYNKAEAMAQKVSGKFPGHMEVKRSLTAAHALPRSVDWRREGVVSAVKNQGQCGSCWAFASTATLESHVALNTGILFDLSAQQFTSCSPNPKQCGGTGGCGGATSEIAFQYALDAGGIAEEWSYSYDSFYGVTSECALGNRLQVAAIDGFHTLPQNDHLALLNAVATVGPIAVTVDASSWHLYEGGVFDGCNKTNPVLNHGVVLVGYGTDEVYGDYWLIRNSWSPTWGEKGYIRLKRPAPADDTCGTDVDPGDGVACQGDLEPQHVCGTCGILFDNVYPLGARLKSGGK